MAAVAPVGNAAVKNNIDVAKKAFEVFHGILKSHRDFVRLEVTMQVFFSPTPLGWVVMENLRLAFR